MPHPGGLWGWGSCGVHLTWSAVLPGPRVWGYGSFSIPVLIHPAHQLVMFSVSVYVIHHTHTHTHTQSLCSQGHHFCVQPWLLPIRCRAGLCPGAGPGLFVWDHHPAGFPGRQRGRLRHVGPALMRLQQELGRAFQLSPPCPRPLVIACPRARG